MFTLLPNLQSCLEIAPVHHTLLDSFDFFDPFPLARLRSLCVAQSSFYMQKKAIFKF